MMKWMMDGNFLENWEDTDVAMHQLAIQLTLVPKGKNSFIQHKFIYWTDCPLGRFLYQTLQHLVAIEWILFDEVNEKYKRNPHFIIE